MSEEERVVWAMVEARFAAEIKTLLVLVEDLVRIVRASGGYTSPEHQATLRGARVLLAEHGRKGA